jgi:DNA polymerase-2
MKGFIVYADYSLEENENKVLLYGRLENGQSFVSVHDFIPYFYIKESDESKCKLLLKNYNIEQTKLANFKGESVIKISAQNSTELNKLHKALHLKKIDTYEADIKPYTRFVIDNNILGSIDIEGDFSSAERIDRIYSNPKISPINFKPNLKVISIDTESDSKGNLFCIGLYGENYKKNFIISKKQLSHAVSCRDEADCLEKFRQEMTKIDPDIITGWNVIDFDLKYLSELFKKHSLPFNIGRSNDSARIRIESNFFRSSTADIPGRIVLDGLNLIKDPFIQEAPSIKQAEFDTYTLEDVSQAILKEGKIISGENRHEQIEKWYKTDQQKVVDYNIQDCKLAYEILTKTDILNLSIERSQLTGLSLDKLSGSIAAFDSLYIREAHKRNLVSPTTLFANKEERIKGGFVKQTSPGLYKNVLVLDFKSLYPSIIRTFNIDPASFLEKKQRDSIETPNKAHFKNNEGILPMIIERLHQAREQAKKDKRELASYAIKIIMNSFFGVLASPNCRYFNLDIANAITHFGQFIIQLTAKEIESKFKTKAIYSDTDSVFVETSLDKHKANALAKEIESHINNFYQHYARQNYNRKSYLELQFDKQFIFLLIPPLRMKQKAKDEEKENAKGAKKRYAGLVEKNGKEEIVVVGLEAIRGDWVDAAREFQMQLLDKLFHNQPFEEFIKDYIKKIKSGKLDEKLIYKKSIRKNLNEYTKTTPPHVKAARLLEHLDSSIIQYYITLNGPEPIQKLKHKIDYEHYIKKQIEPIANQILSALNKSMSDIESNSKQAKLF